MDDIPLLWVAMILSTIKSHEMQQAKLQCDAMPIEAKAQKQHSNAQHETAQRYR